MLLRNKLTRPPAPESSSDRDTYARKLHQLVQANPSAVLSQGCDLIHLGDLFDPQGALKEEFGSWVDRQIELERQLSKFVW